MREGSAAFRQDACVLLEGLPRLRHVEDAPESNFPRPTRRRECLAIVDDDPTGTQTVRDVPVLLSWSKGELVSAAKDPSRLFFVLTNSRGLPENEAAAINEELGELLAEVAKETSIDIRIVSRSDSTLRGHFPTETDALARGWEAGGGHPIDGVVLCPAFIEAGRLVVGGILYVQESQSLVPAAETEFARDPAFSYNRSEILLWAEEKMTEAGAAPEELALVTIEDIRCGGPEQVTRLLQDVEGRAVVAIDAADYGDLDTFVLGLLEAEEAGKRFIYRTGPSFVGARSGKKSRVPLTSEEVYDDPSPSGHGLVVVGSHTGLTTRQVNFAMRQLDLEYIEVDASALLDAGQRESELVRAMVHAERTLHYRDVLVATSRETIASKSPEASLAQSRRISDGLVELVRGLDLALNIRYMVAKGGITANDLAALGLEAASARVVGQIKRGMISVWRLDKRSRRPGLPYVVFPGNVGDDHTLVDVLKVLQGEA